MFRAENTERYGVGTLVVFTDAHLIIALDKKKVGALNVKTLCVDAAVSVADPTWITRKEFDALFDFSGCTFSDFTIRSGVELSKVLNLSY